MILFEEYKFFDHQFPEPQYLGAKHTHLSWINQFIPENVTSVLDAFADSQSVSFLFKQLGLKICTNDFLSFNNKIGQALIENNSQRIDPKIWLFYFNSLLKKKCSR
ncbi:MAG: DNA adenine methylase [Prevotellaceae bacterium]|nr:DNA adenine methylase [Prevotellaceae bacterium]